MGNRQSTESGAELSGHHKAVYACCCSQDGKTILSASGDGTLKLWDVRQLTCVRDFIGHNKVAVYACALSSDGKQAMSGALDGSVKVWDVETGDELLSVRDHQNAVMQVAFNPVSMQAVSASADKTIILWDLSLPEDGSRMTGVKVATLSGHRSAVNAAVFGPSGNTVISGSSDNTVKIWNLANLKEIRTLSGHKDAVMSVAVSPDSTMVVSCSQDQSVGVWSTVSGKLIKMLHGHTDAVSSCVLSDDASFILSASLDRGVIAWVSSGEEWDRACSFHPHRRGITSCAVTPDGMVAVTGSWDNTLKLCPLEDIRVGAQFPQDQPDDSPYSLAALCTDPLLLEDHPALVDVVSDMASMEGAHRAKARMGRLCYYYLRYAKSLGFRRKHRNMILFGQQGTGKGHFAKLVARFYQAAHHSAGADPDSAPNTPPRVHSKASDKTEGDESELTVLKFSKLTADTPELSARKLRRFLEKHSGQVILAKESEWLEAQSVETAQAVMRELQSYLSETPGTCPLLLAARTREGLNALLQHYVPARPGAVRNHFPFIFDFDRYTAEELRDIFKQQCAREQLRLGNTVTPSMLTKTFVLNFSFFDGSNGAGTKHLLTIAKMEHARRPDRREGVLEAGDIQAAFQRLRQDWYAAHPERTFSTLKEMSQKEADRRKARSSFGNEEEASEDARNALTDAGVPLSPTDSADDAGRWSFDIDELKKFHDREMLRKEEEHRVSFQIYQDECRLLVHEWDEARNSLRARMLRNSTNVAERRFRSMHVNSAFANWLLGLAAARRERQIVARSMLSATRQHFMAWVALSKQYRLRRNRDRRTRRLVTCSFMGMVLDLWKHLVAERKAAMKTVIRRMMKTASRMHRSEAYLQIEALAVWEDQTTDAAYSRSMQLEEVKRTREHEESINELSKSHQSELTNWHLTYQEKIRAQKESRKAAESSLQPLMHWRHQCNVLAALLFLLYTAPTFPAVTPYFVATLRTFSFGHWYVGLLILASLIGASRRLFSWLHKSVLDHRVKLALNWSSAVGLDAIVVGVGVAWLCWPYMCYGPDALAPEDNATVDVDRPLDADELLPCMPEDEHVQVVEECGNCSQVKGDGGACKPRVEWLIKAVVAVAGWAVTQEGKEIVHGIWKEGVRAWIKTAAARAVPSWYYSLSDVNASEMVSIVQSESTPLAKKTRACMLLAELASQSQEMRNVITEAGGGKAEAGGVKAGAGGVRALVSILKTVPDSELARSAALTLTRICTSDRVANVVVQGGGLECLVKFWDASMSDEMVRRSLQCSSALVKYGAGSDLIATPKCVASLKAVLSSRNPAARLQGALLVADIAAAFHTQPISYPAPAGQRTRDRSLKDDDADFLRSPGWREQLAPLVTPLVSELQHGWWMGLYCSQPECKTAAVRALGFMAEGSPEDGDRMVRQGLNQALVRILKLRSTWLQSQASILQLQSDAGRTVGAIARGGDLQRGRLQEAGVIGLLDSLYDRLMMEPAPNKEMALMKQHVLNASQAVKGAGHLQRTPPLSGASTPNSSIPSSPRSSPPRGRKTLGGTDLDDISAEQ